MTPASAFRPSPVDIAAGFLIGEDPHAPSLPRRIGNLTPLTALEDVVRPALMRPPCLVAFSGGRDSSAVLALCTDVARREGLSLPVPATVVYPDIPGSEETSWQELVVRHLELREWYRMRVGDELSILGPVAREALGRWGLLWPDRAYCLLPLLRAARGGSFLTGHGGDELLGTRGSALVLAASGHRRPRRRDVLRLGFALSPERVKRRVLRVRDRTSYPWLRPAGERQVKDAFARWSASVPARWDRALNSWWRSRDLRACRQVLTTLANDLQTHALHPFTDPCVLVELRELGGPAGFRSRTAAMELLFGHLLPRAALSRESKAVFDGSLWTDETAEFAESWNGAGVDTALVDVQALRAIWRSSEPDSRTVLLMHSAWLATSRIDG